MPRAGRWLAAALSGVAWAWCFGAEARPVLPWLALAPWLVAVARADRRSERFLLGWLHGTATWLVAVSWIQPTVSVFGGQPWTIGALALLAAALYLGSWHGLFALLAAAQLRRGPAAALLAPAALWVTVEWARGHVPSLGFPWNLAGYALVEVPGALASSAWSGSYGLSFLVVLVNAALAWGWRRRGWRPAAWSLLATALMLALGARFAAPTDDLSAAAGHARSAVEVALVQPDSPLLGDASALAAARDRLLAASRRACSAPRPAGADLLLIWPESAAFPYAWSEAPGLRRAVLDLAARGCPVLLNTPLAAAAGIGIENAALLIGAEGPIGRYGKQRLVPFGEQVPLGELLPFIGTLARISEPFTPGSEPGVLGLGEARFGITICYEVTFPELGARQARDGAAFLVSITNDGWYGDSWAPHQHLRAARFRAAESHRPLLRAALTGISAAIDAHGRIGQRLGVGESGVLRVSVVPGVDRTWFVRAPWAVPLACLLSTVAFGIIPGRRPAPRGPDEEMAHGPQRAA